MQQFGRYQLIRQIAVGGMAEVYLAKTIGVAGFEKPIALKMIHASLAANQEFVQMLVNEAKIAAQLTHPNIAQTLDLGCVDGRYYLAMEYVAGIDLYNLIRAAAHTGLLLPIEACALIMRDVAAALDHAHCKRDDAGQLLGIIHRDVSPDNVLISYEGLVKLVDFGIAKATRNPKSMFGTIKGKWLYMSPEQTRGEPLDATTDVYSAGAVLFEMLTGRTLYEDQQLEPLVALIRTGAFARPSQLRGDVPPQLERIVLRALATNRHERYRSADALASDLQAFLTMYSPLYGTATLNAFVTVILERAGLSSPPAQVEAPPRKVEAPAKRAATLPGVGTRSRGKKARQDTSPTTPARHDTSPTKPARQDTSPTKPDAPPLRPSDAGEPRTRRASRNVIPRAPRPRGPKPEEPEIEMSIEDPSKQIEISISPASAEDADFDDASPTSRRKP